MKAKVKISMLDPDTEKYKTKIIEAEIIYIAGIMCFTHYSRFFNVVSHFDSGMQIATGIDKESTIQVAMSNILSKQEVIDSAKEKIIKFGGTYPVNEIKKY
jgi:hypothetical protein